MSLLLLFSPEAIDTYAPFEARVADRFKKKHKPKELEESEDRPDSEREEITRVEGTKEEITKSNLERTKYLSDLAEEIKGLTNRIYALSELKEVLNKARQEQKVKQLQRARKALDEEFFNELLLQEEHQLIMLMFFMLD